MIPVTDFFLRCANPIGLGTMSGRPIDTLIFVHRDGAIARIAFVGHGRAGQFARILASAAEDLRVEVRPDGLRATTGAAPLEHLAFDAATAVLRVRWRGIDGVFGGPCAVGPFPSVRMPDGSATAAPAPAPVRSGPDGAERQAGMLRAAQAKRAARSIRSWRDE